MKKRMVLCLIACIFTISSMSAMADEILFRGTNWGVNPTEARKQMENADIIMQFEEQGGFLAYPSKTVERLLDDRLNYWYGNYDYFLQGNKVLQHSGMFFGSNKLNVGGFDVSLINLYFAYDIVNEEINEKAENSKFAIANYTFDVIDSKYAYEELLKKLSLLYGKAEEISNEQSGTLYSDRAYPYKTYTYIAKFDGDGGTHAELVCTESIFEAELDGGSTLYLTYWCDEYEAEIKRADEIDRLNEISEKLQEEYSSDSSDISGL